MENTNNSLLTVVSGQGGHSVSVLGSTYRIVIGGEQTNGAYTLIVTCLVESQLFCGHQALNSHEVIK
jgi:hypothetical protein